MEEKDVILKSTVSGNLLHLVCHSSVACYILEKCEELAGSNPRPCITDANSGAVVAYEDFPSLSANFASFLQQSGFRMGDIIINLSHDGSRLHVFFLAVWRCGGIVQCVYPDDDQATLAERFGSSSDVKFILCDEENESKCIEALALLPNGERIKLLVFGSETRGISVNGMFNAQFDSNGKTGDYQLHDLILLGLEDGKNRWKDWLTLAGVFANAVVSRDHIALLLPTSGTTGGSKFVIYTHETLLRNIFLFGRLPFTSNRNQVTLITGKQTHFTGSVCPLALITTGRSLIMMKTVTKKEIFDAVQRYQVASIFSFPSFLTALQDHPMASQHNLTSLKYIFTAGMAVGPNFVATLQMLPNVKYITSVYGMTEAGFLTANVVWYANDYDFAAALDEFVDPTRGRLPPGGMLRVKDIETGQYLGPGQRGELCFNNPLVCTGYWNDVKETSRTFSNGWICTGDVGYYDTEGNIYVLNRVKEVFKYFNNHITPSEIEDVLCSHPGVKQACVIGIDDLEGGGGSIPRAFITLRESFGGGADEILHDVNGRLAPYKHLRGGLYILRDLPRGKSGKVLRQALATFHPNGNPLSKGHDQTESFEHN